ncbi:ATP-dependent RNA helicase DeaD [Oceanisphaera litoralis]|uniref:DEAD/DEAH box helicase n=1 Tax=Oceanisphaera litoralis TaxID=225144 RepID=UPI00195B4025|nr:DEAD/DEAH box helicase [Oceanisphaera litoralis]MBM7454559.1 ATP-dependent RNA helicase DeaD [Oceanisphaera litoralis]
MTNTSVVPATDAPAFTELGLAPEVLKALTDAGYVTPSAIQAAAIPTLLSGQDVLGLAQTGTGKTAAFALPLLSTITGGNATPQVLVLAPTRELAIQVAESFEGYAKYRKDIRILSIYGGQAYDSQIRALKRGVDIVVGTPGRVMDHMRRGTLKLDNLKALVLDEADEMLRMGFIDDVEWILEQTPATRQIALFSATMPPAIQRVAQKYLKNPKEVRIENKTRTNSSIRQRYWFVRGMNKHEGLCRLVETENMDAMLVFVRTRKDAEDLADMMSREGHACEALHGDIPQKLREKVIERLKNGRLNILVATDVVARGLDVERISHVVNFDMPHDNESYVHRIGRTGRAGREGDAILFVTGREKRGLYNLERHTRQPIEEMQMPSADEINKIRAERFKTRLRVSVEADEKSLAPFVEMIESLQADGMDSAQLAAGLARLLQGDRPLFMEDRPQAARRPDVRENRERGERTERPRTPRGGRDDVSGVVMETFRVDVGRVHGVKPGHLVGAIANEADLESRFIGQIQIHDDFSTVDLPEGMTADVQKVLQNVRVCQRPLNLAKYEGGPLPRRSFRPNDDRKPRSPRRNDKRLNG